MHEDTWSKHRRKRGFTRKTPGLFGDAEGGAGSPQLPGRAGTGAPSLAPGGAGTARLGHAAVPTAVPTVPARRHSLPAPGCPHERDRVAMPPAPRHLAIPSCPARDTAAPKGPWKSPKAPAALASPRRCSCPGLEAAHELPTPAECSPFPLAPQIQGRWCLRTPSSSVHGVPAPARGAASRGARRRGKGPSFPPAPLGRVQTKHVGCAASIPGRTRLGLRQRRGWERARFPHAEQDLTLCLCRPHGSCPELRPGAKPPLGPLPMLLLCPPHKHCKALLFGVGTWPPAPGRSVGQGFGEGGFSALRHPNGRAVSSAWNWGPPSARAVWALVVANAPEDGGTRRWHPPWGGLG